MRVILALILALSPIGSAAEETSDLLGISGLARIQQRHTDPLVGKPTDQIRGLLRLDGFLNLDKRGCMQVKARMLTGETFTSDNISHTVGDSMDSLKAKLKISLRHIYLDYSCQSEKFRVELGALPTTNLASGEYVGNLGLGSSGWIDGMRVTIVDRENNREWIFSAGQVSDTKQPNVFKREHNDINHMQMMVRQKVENIGNVLENATFVLSESRHNKTYYTRAGIEAAIKGFGQWLGSEEAKLLVGGELLASDDHLVGQMVHTDFDLKKWNARVTFAHIAKSSATAEDATSLVLKSYMAYGSNVYFYVKRDLSDSLALDMRVRVGDGGKMIETGITKRFCMKKQCVVKRHN